MDHVVVFSFLSLFSVTRCILLQPNQSQVIAPCGRDLTICFAHMNLVLVLLIICIEDFCIYSEKKGSFSPELRLKFISSHHFTSLCLIPSPYFALPTLHQPKPSSHTTSHSLILHQETISLLPNCIPRNYIGHTRRSPFPPIFGAHCEGAFQNWSPAFTRPTCSLSPLSFPKSQSHMWHHTWHHISIG